MEISSFDDSSFEQVAESYIEDYWKYYPHEASFMGIHKYDSILDSVSINTHNELLNKKIKLSSLLSEFKSKGNLSIENMLDLEVLKSELDKDIMSDKHQKRYLSDPSIYIGIAVFACHILILRDFNTKESRYTSLLSRLKEIPRFLEEARENLILADSIPPVWLGISREMCGSAQMFFSRTIYNAGSNINTLQNEIQKQALKAADAFKEFGVFILEELSKKPKGDFIAGREYFNFLVKEYHKLPYSINDIEKIGLQYIEETTKAITVLAKDINPDKEWFEVIDTVKRDVPPANDLLKYYQKEIDRSRKFIIEKNLVSIPEAESLDVIETPLVHRPTYPYAAYMMPGPFEDDQKGIFYVTPVDENASENRKREQLSGHSIPAITVRALHEGYPGHHLQFCVANRIRSKIRRMFTTSLFCEGWALYCEELMKEKRYYRNKATELIQLKDQLWRACRVVIDVRLHTGKLNFEEAVDMLVKTARLEKSSAVAEVKRYSQNPTQPLCYLLGKIEIERLIKHIKTEFPQISEKEMHNKLLSFGSIPIKLIKDSILGTF
jgi:uncharacterized protein (DUF885 family)